MSLYYVVIVFVLLAIFFAKNIGRTRVGRAWVAIRDNDLAAEVMGINVFRYKVLAFVLCSVFTAIAGSLLATFNIYLSPDLFPIMESIWYLGMLIIGGAGSIVGVIGGAVLLRLLGDVASRIGPLMASALPGGTAMNIVGAFGPLVYGLTIILFLIFEPRGLAHRWEMFKMSYRLHPLPY